MPMAPRRSRPLRSTLLALPAALVFAASVMLSDPGLSDAVWREPVVFVGRDAEAFAAALAPDGGAVADVVVIVSLPPSFAGIVLVDIAGGRKHWTVLTVADLGRVLARIGEPA